jgi:hypothetical protein
MELGEGLGVSVGSFELRDRDYSEGIGESIGLTIEKRIGREKGSETSLRVGWFRGSESHIEWGSGDALDLQLDFLPALVIKRVGPAYSSKSGTGAYFGYGAGLTFSRFRVDETLLNEFDEYETFTYSDNTTDIALTGLAGWRFTKSAFAEFSYVWGSDKLNTGVITSIGARF